jgi:lactoylglutathione lyase
MKIKAVDFIFYKVSNLQKSMAFYRDTLGLKPYGTPGEQWAEFEVGNATLSIGSFDTEPITPGGVAVGLAVDDVKKAIEELKAKGVTIVDEPYETPMCFGSTIADPDGNKIYLHKRKDGTAG